MEPQRFQPQTNFFSTTTPRPRPTRPPPPPPPPTPDYDYDQDYYYYDDTGINSGEPVSDLHVKNVDEDYDQNFYSYYSDDGKKNFQNLKKKNFKNPFQNYDLANKLKAILRKFTLIRGATFKISLGSYNRIGLYTNRMFTTESYWRITGKF